MYTTKYMQVRSTRTVILNKDYTYSLMYPPQEEFRKGLGMLVNFRKAYRRGFYPWRFGRCNDRV